jgi:hypothetical protein
MNFRQQGAYSAEQRDQRKRSKSRESRICSLPLQSDEQTQPKSNPKPAEYIKHDKDTEHDDAKTCELTMAPSPTCLSRIRRDASTPAMVPRLARRRETLPTSAVHASSIRHRPSLHDLTILTRRSGLIETLSVTKPFRPKDNTRRKIRAGLGKR